MNGKTGKGDGAALVGVGVAACAVCCAGPILGALAAIGLGTLAGWLLFGSIALAIASVVVVFVLLRRRRRPDACSAVDDQRVELLERR
jgi:type VI protein secretion system component VasK